MFWFTVATLIAVFSATAVCCFHWKSYLPCTKWQRDKVTNSWWTSCIQPFALCYSSQSLQILTAPDTVLFSAGLHAKLSCTPFKVSLPGIFWAHVWSLANKMDEIKLRQSSEKRLENFCLWRPGSTATSPTPLSIWRATQPSSLTGQLTPARAVEEVWVFMSVTPGPVTQRSLNGIAVLILSSLWFPTFYRCLI